MHSIIFVTIISNKPLGKSAILRLHRVDRTAGLCIYKIVCVIYCDCIPTLLIDCNNYLKSCYRGRRLIRGMIADVHNDFFVIPCD